MISRQAVAQYMSKELDTFTWMKKLSEDQLRREFRSWKVRPTFKTDPWIHQLVCFHIGMCYPQFMFLLDMGLGKTKILLDLMTQRLREKKFKRALITVPRLINLGSWDEAILEHSNLEPTICSGRTLDEKWETIANPRGDIVVIDYPGLQYALTSRVSDKRTKEKGKQWEMVKDPKKIAQVSKLYDFFGMDESHKAKNRETLRFKLLNDLTKTMPVRYGTTGTLFGRDPTDIFAQFYLCDRGETFGTTLGLFRAAFFNEVPNRWKVTPDFAFNKSMTRELYRRLQHRSIRYSEDECLDLPERKEIKVKVRFTDKQREHYLRAVDGIVQARGKLRELDSNYLRMRQIVAGFLQWKDEYGEHEVVFDENPKLDALERLIDESGDSKVVVSHEYTRTGELIVERLKEIGCGYEWLYGKSKDPVNAVRRFVSDPSKKVFLMNSESGGTGTDKLQTVARYLVFYECPASPITRQQVLKRVHRPGQLHKTFIYDLVVENSIDVRILSFIAEGRDLHSAVVSGEIPGTLMLV